MARWLVLLMLGLGLFAGFVVSACSSGVPQADFDALKQQLAAKEREVAGLQDQLQAAKASGQQVTALQGQLSAKEKEVADLKDQLRAAQARAQQVAALQEQVSAKEQQLAKAQGAAKLAILSSKPDAPPRATPTPRPPGVTPPPPPVPPASKTVPIGFYVDTVTSGFGESKFNIDPNLSCVRSGVFKRGMHIVWRMQTTDTSSGKILQTVDMEKAVVKLPGGEERRFGFGRHGPTAESPWFWTAAWDVPMDYPLGTIDYSIEVTTKDGKVGVFKELAVESSRLTVIE